MSKDQDFETGKGWCDFAEGVASYRVLDGQRFCTSCGKDHEEITAEAAAMYLNETRAVAKRLREHFAAYGVNHDRCTIADVEREEAAS